MILVLCQWIYGITASDITSVCTAICPFSIFPALHGKRLCAITGNGKWLLYHFFFLLFVLFSFWKGRQIGSVRPVPKMHSVIEKLPGSYVHTRALDLLGFKPRANCMHPLLMGRTSHCWKKHKEFPPP